MHKEGSRTVKGNDAFEGYAIDLIKEIANILGKWKQVCFKIIFAMYVFICGLIIRSSENVKVSRW